MPTITILGSAAAEGIPAIFCNCRVCKAAWKHGGKDFRSRAAYKLNEHVRVDFGPDSLWQEQRFRLHSENLRHLFITHAHEDHLYCDLLNYRTPGFSVVPEDAVLRIYGSRETISRIEKHFAGHPHSDGEYGRFRLQLVALEAFQSIDLPGEDMTFIPLPANHMADAPPGAALIYAIRFGTRNLLLANDTGYFPEETWKFIENSQLRFDLVISDCTSAVLDQRDGHMGGKYVLAARQRLEDSGRLTPGSQYVVNHFSHNGQAMHTELEAHFNPHGIAVGFDGMEIEI